MNRRNVLRSFAAIGGLITVSGLASMASESGEPKKMKRFEQMGGDFSWKPQRLDLEEVSHLAHAAYHHNSFG